MKADTWLKLEKLIAMGRGQGHWDEYQPWLWIRRKNSSPVSNQVVVRLPGYRRNAHYFARVEKVIACLCVWIAGDRVDVREQFPLWPMRHPHPLANDCSTWRDPGVRGLWEIAEEAGIRHGIEPGSFGVPYVASMDLMLSIIEEGGAKRIRGLSLKPHDQITRAEPTDRILERHELERRYMAEVEGSMKIVDTSLVNLNLRTNVELLASVTHTPLPETKQVEDFLGSISRSEGLSVKEAIRLAAHFARVPDESKYAWFHSAVWHRQIDIDLSQEIFGDAPLCVSRSLTDKLSGELFGAVL